MDGKVVIGTDLDTKSFDMQISKLESELEELELRYKQTEEMKPFKGKEEDLQYLGLEIEKTKNKLVALNQQQAKLNNQGFENLDENIKKTGLSLDKVIKKVSKWALAVFGIRSAYMAVRNAINVISGEDKQLKADIDYIKNIIAYTLEPVVKAVVEAVKRILYFVGYVIKLWTGKNIFEDADKKLKNANKNANKLKKTLASFDEINIIGQDGKEGTYSASIDLSNLDDFDTSSIYNWIGKVKDIVVRGFGEIGNNISKIFLDMGFSQEFLYYWGELVGNIQGMFGGVFDTIQGVLRSIVGLLTGDTGDFVGGLQQAVGGIFDIFKNCIFGIQNLWGLLNVGIRDVFVTPVWNKIVELGTKIGNKFKEVWDKVSQKAGEARDKIRNFFSGLPNFFNTITGKIKEFFVTLGTKAGNVVGDAFKKVINAVLGAIESILNSPIKAINKMIDTINKLPGVNMGKMQTFSLPRLARGGIVNNPGSGVLMGNYIAGEKGAEAVLPLTDDTLQRLANMIPITIDLTNTLDSRIIGKRIIETNRNKSFARNGV